MALTTQTTMWEGIQIQSDVDITPENLASTYGPRIPGALLDARVFGCEPFIKSLYELSDVDHIEISGDTVTAMLKPGATAKTVRSSVPSQQNNHTGD